MRVLLLSIGSVLFLLMALSLARIWGLSTQFQRFEHPFWNQAKPVISVRVRILDDIRTLVRAKPDIVPWLDVRQTSDKQFIILPDAPIRELLVEKSFPADKWRGPQPSRYTLAELRPIFSDAPLLEEALKQFPDLRFILNVIDNNNGIHEDLVKLLEPLNPDKRILIQSDTDVILSSLKEKKPLWLYGTSRAELMRMLTFESVGILPATTFRADVLIVPLTLHDRPAYNRGVLDEIHRRKKEYFIGPLSSAEEYDKAHEENPDGYIFSAPEIALRMMELEASAAEKKAQ